MQGCVICLHGGKWTHAGPPPASDARPWAVGVPRCATALFFEGMRGIKV